MIREESRTASSKRKWFGVDSSEKSSDEILPSPTVRNVIRGLGPKSEVGSAALAREIFNLHGEYAAGSAARVELSDTSTRQTVNQWIADVAELFDFDQILKLSKKDDKQVLHGRLLIIGLSLLDSELQRQLENAGVFTELISEVEGPLTRILSVSGQKLYGGNTVGEQKTEPDNFESVPTWPDDPVTQPDQDLLGRAAFARFLAERIAAIPRNTGSYSIHIFGPWGAGKSTLLNFLRAELERRSGTENSGTAGAKWLVVDFNAWLHQHIQPPWWSMMERIFEKTKRQLTRTNRIAEYLWRLNSGRLLYFLGVIVLAWIGVFVIPLLLPANGTPELKTLSAGAESISRLIALVTTIWGGIFAVKRSLMFSSSQAAQTYAERTHDPAGEIKRRFNGLIKKLEPSRVIILIDDLDRCQSRYVVDLLEGIQTLFREAPVVFVIAADRGWLNACYEEVYENLHPQIHEPGKPMGLLFLEKAFRFSTPMPGIPEQMKKDYWGHLLSLTTPEGKADLASARLQANKILKGAGTETAVRDLLENTDAQSFIEQRVLREEAAVRLASPDVIKRIEHTLKPYANLLEPNPRSMKLLVNSYSANRALSILSEVKIELHQLALWTILCSRWPTLADYLVEHPEQVSDVLASKWSNFPDGLKSLETEPDVLKVIKGSNLKNSLTAVTLRKCARMRS